MLSLTVQFNEKQVERLVFSAWTEYTVARKDKIRILKSRVIKNLRVYVARRKFLRLMDGKNKILRREENLRTMQKMLNAFKYFKVYHLFTKTLHKIDDEITPTMHNVNGLIHEYVGK